VRKALDNCPKSVGRLSSWYTRVQAIKAKGIDPVPVAVIPVSPDPVLPVYEIIAPLIHIVPLVARFVLVRVKVVPPTIAVAHRVQ
jgi:hypothetical protein